MQTNTSSGGGIGSGGGLARGQRPSRTRRRGAAAQTMAYVVGMWPEPVVTVQKRGG